MYGNYERDAVARKVGVPAREIGQEKSLRGAEARVKRDGFTGRPLPDARHWTTSVTGTVWATPEVAVMVMV